MTDDRACLEQPINRTGSTVKHPWPSLNYTEWSATCDTLHAHTQVLGKLAAALAPPDPQLQHAALRLTARGWETLSLPASDRSGALVAGLDLRVHEAFLEHSDTPTPDTSVSASRPTRAVPASRVARSSMPPTQRRCDDSPPTLSNASPCAFLRSDCPPRCVRAAALSITLGPSLVNGRSKPRNEAPITGLLVRQPTAGSPGAERRARGVVLFHIVVRRAREPSAC